MIINILLFILGLIIGSAITFVVMRKEIVDERELYAESSKRLVKLNDIRRNELDHLIQKNLELEKELETFKNETVGS